MIRNFVFKIKQIMVLAMMWWALSACLSSPDCSRKEVFCAALVTDTLSIEDHGINQDAWAGLQTAKETDLADQVDYIESVDVRDYKKNIVYFADLGYDVIFTSGVALDDETLQSADLYPDSTFVGLNQTFEESRLNLISVTFPEDQMGFAAGASAARLTKTKLVAAVCETSGIDAMWRYCEGFRAGVKFVDNTILTTIVYRDNGDREKIFIDEDWGYSTGVDLIKHGVDVIFAAGGVTGQGAVKAASEYGIYSIGAERDQSAVLGVSGTSVVTSFYGQGSFEVQEMMRLIRGGEAVGATSGPFQYVPLGSEYPMEFNVELDALVAALNSGKIETNVSKSR